LAHWADPVPLGQEDASVLTSLSAFIHDIYALLKETFTMPAKQGSQSFGTLA